MFDRQRDPRIRYETIKYEICLPSAIWTTITFFVTKKRSVQMEYFFTQQHFRADHYLDVLRCCIFDALWNADSNVKNNKRILLKLCANREVMLERKKKVDSEYLRVARWMHNGPSQSLSSKTVSDNSQSNHSNVARTKCI